MEYLRHREQRLRDTNESTNERVKWFAIGTMGMLIGLGAWQVVYLRAYFRWVISIILIIPCDIPFLLLAQEPSLHLSFSKLLTAHD